VFISGSAVVACVTVKARLAVLLTLLVFAATTSISSSALGASGSTGDGVPQTDAAGTVWLCRPGLASDPCAGNLSSTVVTASGQRTVRTQADRGSPKFNCFYLYPTSSTETTVNSDLTVQPSEVANATAQADRFSQVCNVWAPMYRSITVSGLGVANTTDPGAYTVAYDSVLSAWNDFLVNYDNGRPIIFIGHSQGSVMLIKLLQAQMDKNPRLQKLLVTAIVAGGNVTVPTGKTVGTTFQNIPLCGARQLSGCVIAYSSFPSEPPSNANFGRPGQGISLNTGQTATTGVQVACVNPAAIGGGTGYLKTYWPISSPPPIPSMLPPAPSITTPWVYYPDQYTGTCEYQDGASWLQVTPVSSSDTRPLVKELAGAAWGYHFQDINLSLGNLVQDARVAEVAYQGRPWVHHPHRTS
jgi:hypothetical protein